MSAGPNHGHGTFAHVVVALNVLGFNIVKRPQDHVVAAGRWAAGRVGRGIGGAARWVSEWARVSSLH